METLQSLFSPCYDRVKMTTPFGLAMGLISLNPIFDMGTDVIAIVDFSRNGHVWWTAWAVLILLLNWRFGMVNLPSSSLNHEPWTENCHVLLVSSNFAQCLFQSQSTVLRQLFATFHPKPTLWTVTNPPLPARTYNLTSIHIMRGSSDDSVLRLSLPRS